jgi:GNAT superfamily N-acetyltransferase
MSETYVIKKITKSDAEQAEAFLIRMMKVLFNSQVNETYHKDILNLETFYIENEDQSLIGAFDSTGNIVGTIGAKCFLDRFPALDGRYKEVKTVEVGRCYIEAHLRKQGIGSMLFDKFIEFCHERAYEKIYLHTHRHLPGGFQFWLKKGFEVTVEEEARDIVHMELNPVWK